MRQLEKALNQLNISVSGETVSKFEKYMKQVLEWNEKVNVTAITNEEDFVKKHFIDSVLCANFDEIGKADHIIDVGTGAGFPGVPLALIFPEKQFLLIDSLGKRIKILDEMVGKLEIPNVKTLHTRAEDLARNKAYREKFDGCVSRAVANLATLAEYCLPFVKIGGAFLSYKGPEAVEELKSASKAIKLLGGEAGDVRKVALEGFEFDHNIVIVKKIQKTPDQYPRKAGTPAKTPL